MLIQHLVCLSVLSAHQSIAASRPCIDVLLRVAWPGAMWTIITVSCREVLRDNGFVRQKITHSSFQKLGDPQRQRCSQDTFHKQPLKSLHVRRR